MRLIFVTALSVFVLVACSRDDDHRHPQLKTGRQLYQHHCASCHLDAGDRTFVKGIPAVKDTSMTYRQMTDHIRGHGRAGDSLMPEFSSMSQKEAEAIAIYIRNSLGAG